MARERALISDHIMFLCAQSFACQLKIYPDFYAGIRKRSIIFQLGSRFLFECLE